MIVRMVIMVEGVAYFSKEAMISYFMCFEMVCFRILWSPLKLF